MMSDPRFGMFYLPPGADFADMFAQGLRQKYAGFAPHALARVTVYLNSERMRRRVKECLIAQGSGFLPRMRLVTDLVNDPVLSDLPPVEPPMRRLLILGQLVGSLLASETKLAPGHAAFDLAESLGGLIDEMQAEGVSPDRIAKLDAGPYAEYWQRVQQFLGIVAPFFADETAIDSAARQRIAAQRLAQRWKDNPPADPVIVAGSTGSRGPAYRLMQAVAALPQGALVVPAMTRLQRRLSGTRCKTP